MADGDAFAAEHEEVRALCEAHNNSFKTKVESKRTQNIFLNAGHCAKSSSELQHDKRNPKKFARIFTAHNVEIRLQVNEQPTQLISRQFCLDQYLGKYRLER